MRWVFTFIFQILCLHWQIALAFELPEENQGNWTVGVDVGVDGGIGQYLAGGRNDRALTGNVIDVTQAPYNADYTGLENVREAVAAAIAAAAPGDVIYFPAGKYLFSSGWIPFDYKHDITIRGAGTGATIMHCSTTDVIFHANDPGDYNNNIQAVSGTKAKGTSRIEVVDSSVFQANGFVHLLYENENDITRISNGATPVWSAGGYPMARRVTAAVTEIPDASHIVIDPPLPADASNLDLYISSLHSGLIWRHTDGLGFEDFSITFDKAAHPVQFARINDSVGSWFYNLEFRDFSRISANGSCIKIAESYKCQISRCSFTAVEGSSSDGAIELLDCSSILIENNAIIGDFGVGIYDSGNLCNSVIAYNFRDKGSVSHFHNAHPSLNLIEGNVAGTHQSDGYFGSSSHNTFFRNWFWEYGAILDRFKRNYVIVGNVIGEDGVQNGTYVLGNPNIGNWAADGFAGPTGSSTQEGGTDFSQPDFGRHEYVIQDDDIFKGDFWQDWEITGTLRTRISDTEGIFTVSGGNWFVGTSHTGANRLYPVIHWLNKSKNMGNGEVTDVSGSEVTITFPWGVLPAESTEVQMYMGPAGWQERDLDVRASCTFVHNYEAQVLGKGSISNPTTDTLPPSFAYTSQPSWWNEEGFSGPWPPMDPNQPSFGKSSIPANYRYTVEASSAPQEPTSLQAH